MNKKNTITDVLLGIDTLLIAQAYCSKKKICVIANNHQDSKRIFDELSLFSNISSQRTLLDNIDEQYNNSWPFELSNPTPKTAQPNIAQLIDYDILPYECIAPSPNVVAGRIKTIWGLQQNKIDILITQASVLFSKLPSPNFLFNHHLVLHVGDKIDITKFKGIAIDAGYVLVEKIYELGEIAVRGSIIDIWPSGNKFPIRVELFDDEIERIYLLKNYSKKHNQQFNYQETEMVDYFEVIPAKEYAQTDQIGNDIKKNHALKSMINSYLPIFFEHATSLFDYLAGQDWVIIHDSELKNTLDKLWQENADRYLQIKQKYFCLPPAELFFAIDNIFAKMKQFAQYQFKYIDNQINQTTVDNNYVNNSVNNHSKFNHNNDLEANNQYNLNNNSSNKLSNSQSNDQLNNQSKNKNSNIASVASWQALPSINSLDQLHHFLLNNQDKKVFFCISSLGKIEIIKKLFIQKQILQFTYADSIENALSNHPTQKYFVLNNFLYKGFIYYNYIFVSEYDIYKYQDEIIRKRIYSTKDTKHHELNSTRENSKYKQQTKYQTTQQAQYSTPNYYSQHNQTILSLDSYTGEDLIIGELVVHIDHGIARYNGLINYKIDDYSYDMIELQYKNNTKMYFPIASLSMISRYRYSSTIDNSIQQQIDDIMLADEEQSLEQKLAKEEELLSDLGRKSWQKTRIKVEQQVSDLAAELFSLYSKRNQHFGYSFAIPEEYERFVELFGHEATIDQNKCFHDVIVDMSSPYPMDRLICGDVGFGKTEVAMRAAFISAMNGKQVVLISPTTLLANQHYNSFINRFIGFSEIKIVEVSRFCSKTEIELAILEAQQGSAHILIGTHRLLQNDIKFADLGLIIIDEEHRFGVKQKEQLKKLRANVDCLMLTATPIPRTLSMALDGMRQFSIISTPPKKRLSVKTLLIDNNDFESIKEAVMREMRRGGQVYFLYNDLDNIGKIEEQLKALLPQIRIGLAHGRMTEHDLEFAIKNFILQQTDLLLCSTIIESGINIQNANTIIIYNAYNFGLAQLYQLRGRVGRSHHQAYCYLTIPEKISKNAKRRLEAICATDALGSGFNLAVYDLEIRGSGQILGDKQSGNIKNVGLQLYSEMLKRSIDRLYHPTQQAITCEASISASALLPHEYCQSVDERVAYYHKLSNATDEHEIDHIYQELIDNYGMPPPEVKTLFNLHYLKLEAINYGIYKMDLGKNNITLKFVDNPPFDSSCIINIINHYDKHANYTRDNQLIIHGLFNHEEDKFLKTREVFGMLNTK